MCLTSRLLNAPDEDDYPGSGSGADTMGRTSVALAEQFTDEQLWGELLRTRARGIDPWWIRRREYLERAGRYDLIETEGLRQLEWRAGMLLRRWKP